MLPLTVASDQTWEGNHGTHPSIARYPEITILRLPLTSIHSHRAGFCYRFLDIGVAEGLERGTMGCSNTEGSQPGNK